MKKAKKPICGLLFLRMTESCSMAGCNREVPSAAFYSGSARALAVASGGSAGRCGYIRTYCIDPLHETN